MLMVEQLQKSFGGVAALDGCSFNAAESHITAIIGPNGAGKSTLLNCISGATKPDCGRITLFDNNVTAEKPHRLARAGLARTFQISRELSSLTLLENVLLAQQSQSDEHFFTPIFLRGRILKEEKAATERAMQLLTRVGLERLADETASVLSGGQKKLLELARALMLNPRVVLLDEPAAGVAPPMVQVLIEVIKGLQGKGVSFILVEHNMDMVAALSDHVVVMAEGKKLVEGTFKDVTSDRRVADAYLGGVL